MYTQIEIQVIIQCYSILVMTIHYTMTTDLITSHTLEPAYFFPCKV